MLGSSAGAYLDFGSAGISNATAVERRPLEQEYDIAAVSDVFEHIFLILYRCRFFIAGATCFHAWWRFRSGSQAPRTAASFITDAMVLAFILVVVPLVVRMIGNRYSARGAVVIGAMAFVITVSVLGMNYQPPAIEYVDMTRGIVD